jgi:hypothetical protein
MLGNLTPMSVRWYSVVVDCHDIKAQSRWWAEALDWRIVFESDDEVGVVPPALDAPRDRPRAPPPPGLARGLAWGS